MRDLIAIKVSDMADVSANAVFKNNVRDALLFFDAAKSLGFPSFLTDDHEEVIKTAFDYIMEIARNVDGLQLPLENAEEPKKPAREDVRSNLFIEESVNVVKNKFQFLTVLQSMFLHDDGCYILKMKESIQGALEFLRESVLKFVTYLKTTAEAYKSGEILSPFMLDELLKKYHLCECYLPIDNCFTADSPFRFITVGQSFKSLIMDISKSTQSKILMHDYSGILDDLKKFDRNIPTILKEVEHILQLVFRELHNEASKIAQSALTYRLDTTTALVGQALINDLHTISEMSILYMAYVSETQKPVIGIRFEIVTIINQTTSLICEECTSSLNSLQLSSVNFNFVEAEGVIKSAESMLLLLEKLANDMANDRKAQEPLITQVKFYKIDLFYLILIFPFLTLTS